MGIELLIVLLLILINGLFAMGEMAVVSVRKARLKQMAENGHGRAGQVLALSADPTRFLSTIQIGITLVGVLTGVFGGATLSDGLARVLADMPAIAPYAQSVAMAVVVLGIAYATLILGELVPKRVALAAPERVALLLVPVLRVFSSIAAPLAWALAVSTDIVMILLRLKRNEDQPVTDEEIRLLMREGTDAGHFHEAERSIVDMALKLGDRRVEALMTPRTRMEVIDLSDPPRENHQRIIASHYSRFPVVEGDPANVLGVVETKTLLAAALDGKPVDIRAAMQPPLYIPDTAPALKALELFKQSGRPIALIVDEYGDIQGLLTLNDLLEALVGDIATPGQVEEPDYVRREDGSWLIDGMMPVEEVAELIGLASLGGQDDVTTLGGLMMAQLKRIPVASDHVDIDGYRFEVMDMDGRRVDKVLIVPPKSEPE